MAWFSHLTLASSPDQMVHPPQLLPWLEDPCGYIPFTIGSMMNMFRLMLYTRRNADFTFSVANNLPLFFSSGPPTVSRILVKFCTAVLQAISSFPVNTNEKYELYETNLHRTRIDIYMHIPSVAACSLGHNGSDRSSCACSSNIGSLHKRTDNLSWCARPHFQCTVIKSSAKLTPSHDKSVQVAISLLIHQLFLYGQRC